MISIKNGKITKPVLAVLLVCLVVGIGYYVHSRVNQSSKAVFSIDGKNYSGTDVKKLIKYPVSLGETNDQAAKDAFDALKKVRAAQKLGYNPSSAEIAAQKQTIYANIKLSASTGKQYSDWFNLLATAAAIDDASNSSQPNGYSGYSYVFSFGQHLQAIPDYTIPGFNDPGLIAQDKAYAKERANYYYNQLKNHKISPADALMASITDMRSRGTGPNNSTYSVKFVSNQGINSNWSSAVYLQPIIQYISTLHNTGVSTVQVGKAANKSGPGSKQVDMYYYFVDLDAAPKGMAISLQALNQQLSTLPAQFRGFK